MSRIVAWTAWRYTTCCVSKDKGRAKVRVKVADKGKVKAMTTARRWIITIGKVPKR